MNATAKRIPVLEAQQRAAQIAREELEEFKRRQRQQEARIEACETQLAEVVGRINELDPHGDTRPFDPARLRGVGGVGGGGDLCGDRRPDA